MGAYEFYVAYINSKHQWLRHQFKLNNSNLFNQQYEGKIKIETWLLTCEKL